jgi:hypothetical protein
MRLLAQKACRTCVGVSPRMTDGRAVLFLTDPLLIESRPGIQNDSVCLCSALASLGPGAYATRLTWD